MSGCCDNEVDGLALSSTGEQLKRGATPIEEQLVVTCSLLSQENLGSRR